MIYIHLNSSNNYSDCIIYLKHHKEIKNAVSLLQIGTSAANNRQKLFKDGCCCLRCFLSNFNSNPHDVHIFLTACILYKWQYNFNLHCTGFVMLTGFFFLRVNNDNIVIYLLWGWNGIHAYNETFHFTSNGKANILHFHSQPDIDVESLILWLQMDSLVCLGLKFFFFFTSFFIKLDIYQFAFFVVCVFLSASI